jgi:SPP1 gp7 family putative phage head morphogenesis protein
MATSFAPTPHEEAVALIKGKPAVTRAVFDRLLPEIKARAFTITGIEAADIQQDIRDTIASLAQGENWDDVKDQVAAALEASHIEGAEKRATLLIRTHGFQAFQAANWRVAQEDEDTTHMQYLATEDGNARESHLALNGIILPKDDPFWDTHTPPWDWGCRCRIRPMNPDMVDEARQDDEGQAPEDRNVLAPAVADQLRNGTLLRNGQRFDVTPPKDQGKSASPYEWNPRSLRLPMDEILKRYDDTIAQGFREWSQNVEVNPQNPGSLWDWLTGKSGAESNPVKKPKEESPLPGRKAIAEKLKSKGFSQDIIDTAVKVPSELDHHLETLNMDVGGGATGLYRSYTKTIEMGNDTTKWAGRPELFHHEFGHHIHFQTGHVTGVSIHPEIESAMKADLKRLKEEYKEKMDGLLRPNVSSTMAEKYGYIGNLNMEQKAEVGACSDTICALTGGKYGFGHSRRYYKTQPARAMEAYANTVSAIIRKDQVYMDAFPNLVLALKTLLKLP